MNHAPNANNGDSKDPFAREKAARCELFGLCRPRFFFAYLAEFHPDEASLCDERAKSINHKRHDRTDGNLHWHLNNKQN